MATMAPRALALSCTCAAVAAIVLASGRSDADAGDHDKAVALFDEARRFVDAGDCESAIAKLEQSLRYEPSVGANLTMGECYEARDPVKAWTHLREAERLAYMKHDDRRQVAKDRAAALEPRLPMVRLVVPRAVLEQQGMELRVDGALVAPYLYEDGTLALPPGPHVLDATLPGKKSSQHVVAQAAATTPVTVDMDAERPAPPPPAPRPSDAPLAAAAPGAGSTQRSVAFVIGGAGVTALAAGAVLGIIALNKQSDIDSACGGNAASCTAAVGSLDGARSEQHTFAHLSTLGFAVGGTALAGAAVLYFTAPRASNAPRVGFAPAVGRDGASAVVSGTW